MNLTTKTSFLLLPFTIFLIYQVSQLYNTYQTIIHPKIIEQKIFNFHYQIIPSTSQKSTLLLLDLLGINNLNKNTPASLKKNLPKDQKTIILSRIPKHTPETYTAKSLLMTIADDNNIMIADNFCTPNWSELSKKSIYKNTSFSPGQRCFNSLESRFIDRLIKKYNIQNVIIPYTNDVYLKLISNFLDYLKNKNIAYTLKNVERN